MRAFLSLLSTRRWQAPRRLSLTRAGWFVTGVSLALGLVAIQSGNNPLFFLWGMLLGGIVLSGVLSEACLRPLHVRTQVPAALRVGEPTSIALLVHNTSRIWPAFALSWRLRLRDALDAHFLHAPYVLRLDQHEHQRLWTGWTPGARGQLRLEMVHASTAYPFGLFVKERPFVQSGSSAFVRPRKVEVESWVGDAYRDALGLGRAQQSQGDDFGMLRAFRVGDPWRRVLWRRAAASGRWLVAETQSDRADSLVLLVRLSPQATASPSEEQKLETAGSLAEYWLQRGVAVGLWTHGASLPAECTPGQAGKILDALARVSGDVPVPKQRPIGGTILLVGERDLQRHVGPFP